MTRRILLAEDQDYIREIFVAHIESFLDDSEVVQAWNGQEAIRILQEDQSFDLIISDYNMPEATGGDLYHYIRSKKINLPFLLITSEDIRHLQDFEGLLEDNPLNGYLIKPATLKEIQTALTSCLNLDTLDSQLSHDYKRVRISFFWRFNKTLCDIYLRLSEDKFVKIINKNTTYSKNDISKYTKKNQKYFYLKEKDYLKFSAALANTNFLTFEPQGEDPKELEEYFVTTHAIMHDLLLNIGISQSVVDLAEKQVDGILERVEGFSGLRNLLLAQRKKQNYIYDHSYLISNICCAISKQLDWSTPQTLTKLIYASLFHDLTFDDSELAYKFDSITDESELQKFDSSEITLYQNHSTKMAELIRGHDKFFPLDVDKIVEQHHENAGGASFIKGMQGSSSKLSAIFILAHYYVAALYKVQFDEEKNDQVLEKVYQQFAQNPLFKAPVEALTRCF